MENFIDVGNKIGFRYKGNRYVRILITSVAGKVITGVLFTDYIGKNEEWFIGEHKSFHYSQMRKISNQTPK